MGRSPNPPADERLSPDRLEVAGIRPCRVWKMRTRFEAATIPGLITRSVADRRHLCDAAEDALGLTSDDLAVVGSPEFRPNGQHVSSGSATADTIIDLSVT